MSYLKILLCLIIDGVPFDYEMHIFLLRPLHLIGFAFCMNFYATKMGPTKRGLQSSLRKICSFFARQQGWVFVYFLLLIRIWSGSDSIRILIIINSLDDIKYLMSGFGHFLVPWAGILKYSETRPYSVFCPHPSFPLFSEQLKSPHDKD